MGELHIPPEVCAIKHSYCPAVQTVRTISHIICRARWVRENRKRFLERLFNNTDNFTTMGSSGSSQKKDESITEINNEMLVLPSDQMNQWTVHSSTIWTTVVLVAMGLALLALMYFWCKRRGMFRKVERETKSSVRMDP